MGIFDYKTYTTQEAKDKALLSHDLAEYVSKKRGLPLDNPLPQGWRELTPSELGLPADVLDKWGFYPFDGPVTGDAFGGPQMMMFGQFDETGALISIAASYAPTNHPTDRANHDDLPAGTGLEGAEVYMDALASYASTAGLTGADAMITGYSQGAGWTNVIARNAEDFSNGFYLESDFIGHGGPVIYDDNERVLNIGYENDVVHRAAGEFLSGQAARAANPDLLGQDLNFDSSTDNLILFNDVFASRFFPFGDFAFDNLLGGWAAHIAGVPSDALDRIANSRFYDLTERDSVIIVSQLSDLKRKFVWVEDKATQASDHLDAPAFVIGSEKKDKLGGAAGNDYIEGLGGNDHIRTGLGADVVDGGQGWDKVYLQGNVNDWQAFSLGDGATAFFSAEYGLDLTYNVESVQFSQSGFFRSGTFKITDDGLLSRAPFRFFRRNNDVEFEEATQGDDADNQLIGNVVFAQAGDDIVMGTLGDSLLHGGMGADQIMGGSGDDHLYGAEDDDILYASSGSDRFNGGHGNDMFVFGETATGHVVVEDFNQSANETDMLAFAQFQSLADVLEASTLQNTNVVIEMADLSVTLNNTTLDELTQESVFFLG